MYFWTQLSMVFPLTFMLVLFFRHRTFVKRQEKVGVLQAVLLKREKDKPFSLSAHLEAGSFHCQSAAC